MPPILAGLFSQVLYKPVLRPVVRIICGLVAIPLFRFFLRRVLKLQTNDAELERDLEHWFRASILLLAATANSENFLFQNSRFLDSWESMLLRLLLAVGVIETMPDEDLFSLIHSGPPKLKLGRGFPAEAWARRMDIIKGCAVLHLKRSSPVLVIMCVVFGDPPGTPHWMVGWWCYGLAVVQYLIIALCTDRGRAANLLAAIHPENIPSLAERMRSAAGDCGAFAEPEADPRHHS